MRMRVQGQHEQSLNVTRQTAAKSLLGLKIARANKGTESLLLRQIEANESARWQACLKMIVESSSQPSPKQQLTPMTDENRPNEE